MMSLKSNFFLTRAAQCERQGFFWLLFQLLEKVTRRQAKRYETRLKNNQFFN